jgi:transposase
VPVREPEEIQDEAYERVLDRVCGIDVGKTSGKVCTRVPHSSRPGQRRTRVWDVEATTNAVMELGEYLVGEGIEKVTLESTSDYWRIWFYLLEAAGLDVQLVNARDVKNAPGRPKTDKLDSVWQAKMTERGMLRPSFVPPVEIRQLRDYTRMRVDLTRERTRYWQRLEKLLEDALIKVSAVASTLDTKSVRDMLEALIAGERDPRVLADLARGRMKAKRAALIEALTGRFDDHHAELTRMLLDQIDQLTRQIDRLTARIEELIAAIPAAQGADADGTTGPSAGRDEDAAVLPAIDRLDEIIGIGREAAQAVIAEAGRRGALLRRAPLRTVHATRRRTRLKQAAGALRVVVLASCVCGLGARAGRRRVSSGFGSCPACRARHGGRGSRRRLPAGPRSATSVPIPVETGAAGRW